MPTTRFPHSLVLIFAMIVIAQLATYVLPAGKFQRIEVKGHERVVPGTYEKFEADTLPVYACLSSVPEGMQKGASIIFFVFIVGGVIGVIRATGSVDAMIGTAIEHLGSSPLLLVSGMVTLFAIGSATIGMAEEYMPFIPILVTMCLAMKMDAIVAMGIVYIGAGIGYGCACINPFTVVIAQDIAGLQPYSGWPLRVAFLAVCLIIGVHHIMRYANRLKDDPEHSLVKDIDYTDGFTMPTDTSMTLARICIIAVFVAGIAFFVWGSWKYEWYLGELSTIFLSVALMAAVLARLTPNQVANSFCYGATELTTTALLIGFAYTIQVVLDKGGITDTVINTIAQPLQKTGPEVTSLGMLMVQSVCNFFVPSGSGQAYVTIPIMAPLADLTGVTRQTSVLAYQIGDGFTNMIVPTNALLMGMLGLGRIPFQRWLRFIMPLMIKLFIAAAVVLVIAVKIEYA